MLSLFRNCIDRLRFHPFFHISMSKSRNKAQCSGTYSTILCYLTRRITSPLGLVVSTTIFLSIRVSFQSSYSPCVKTCEVRYVEMKRLKLESGRLALGSGKGCQSRNIHEWYGYVVPIKLGPGKVSICMP
jgi:hypothetical protein